ncbi:RDD family protein [Sulfuricurvum sp.]|uniref:RDD family protein n=1 Tax=Sulfuricurvum sp. TaxID=2025608 RepID=UPI00286DD76F|nr:RDD family protein [Sulfuricurvum sp.]
MIYAGFWRRFGAYWIDAIILLPLSGIIYLMNDYYRLAQLYYFVPNELFLIWFDVYLLRKYGGTPGKLLMKLRVTMLDGARITLKAAFLRYIVLFILMIIAGVGGIIAKLNITDEQYYSFSYIEKGQKLIEYGPFWQEYIIIMIQIWIFSEFITMMFNKKRRAVHDFMAGTVVVKVDTKTPL